MMQSIFSRLRLVLRETVCVPIARAQVYWDLNGATANGGGSVLTDTNSINAGFTLNGSLTGSGALTKSDSASLALNQSGTFTGGTSVTAGRLHRTGSERVRARGGRGFCRRVGEGAPAMAAFGLVSGGFLKQGWLHEERENEARPVAGAADGAARAAAGAV
jgi:autotransporter-associated beta strand protein